VLFQHGGEPTHPDIAALVTPLSACA